MAKQGSAHIFSKVSILGFAGQTVSVTTITLALVAPRQPQIICRQIDRALYPHHISLQALKFEFYVIFTCLLISFRPFKNLETLVSLQAIQKQGAGQI